MRFFANAFSVLFHPLFVPLWSFGLLFHFFPHLFSNLDNDFLVRFFVMLTINTVLFPLITFLLMVKLGFVSSLKMPEKKDRILPYIGVSFFYIWTWTVMRNMPIHHLVPDLMLGATLSLFLAFFVNIFFKISAHAVSSSALIAVSLILVVWSGYILAPILGWALLLAGTIGTARLYLQAHTPAEVYSGYLVGLAGFYTVFFIL